MPICISSSPSNLSHRTKTRPIKKYGAEMNAEMNVEMNTAQVVAASTRMVLVCWLLMPLWTAESNTPNNILLHEPEIIHDLLNFINYEAIRHGLNLKSSNYREIEGQIYFVNDVRYFDWPNGLRRYIDNVRQGRGQTRKQYSAWYICSLVADLHRNILYGGIAMNPRSHLRLVFEANPLSCLVEQGGGRGTDGTRRILEINPYELHQRLPLFLGSTADVAELVSYGDVQQIKNPGYSV